MATKKRKQSLGTLAIRALRQAVKGAVEEHRRLGIPLIVWRNGKVVRLSPSRVSLR